MTTDPAKRTDRTARKATAEQVMELSRNLPLTRSVPGRAVENATPGQLGFLAALFTAENASRAESKRNRLPGQAGFPQAKTLDGYDRGHGRVPHRLGTRTARVPRVHSATPRTSCSTDDAGMRAGPRLAIAIGTLACRRGIPVRFFTASGLIMRLRKAKTENRLDQELKTIGKADLLVIDELGYLPIDIDGARLLFQIIADSYERRSIIFTSNLEFGRWGDVFGDGDMAAAVIDRIDPPRTHHPIPRRILPKHPLTHEINNNQGNQPTAHTVQPERRQCPE